MPNGGLECPQIHRKEKAKVPRPWSSNKVTSPKHKGASSQGKEKKATCCSVLSPQQLSIQSFPQKTNAGVLLGRQVNTII